MLIISAGLQKSGSALIFNMINDIIVYNHGSDVRSLKDKYNLGDILQYHNCNISDFSWPSLKPLLFLSLRRCFVVKTHKGPTTLINYLLRLNLARTVLIIRDPRDIIVSAMDHGKKLREEGRNDTFATCVTIDDTLIQVKQWINTVLPWFSKKNVMVLKYEELLASPDQILTNTAAFLNLKTDKHFLEGLKRRYDAQNPDESVRNILHYNKAIVHRYREIFTLEELNHINVELQPQLKLLGYKL